MIKARVIIFILALSLWLLLSWSLSVQDLAIGALIALMVCWLTIDMFPGNTDILKVARHYLWFIYYIPLFAWECLKANLDSAYRVMHPDLPIKPGIVKIKTGLKSESGMVFLANTLTLLPGTMAIDIDREGGFLYVHWVDVKAQDAEEATKILVYKFERILKRMFG